MLSNKNKALLNSYIQSGKVSVTHTDGETTYFVDHPDLPYFLTFEVTYICTIGASIIVQYDIFAGSMNISSAKHNILSTKPENPEIKNILDLIDTCSRKVIYQETQSKHHGFINSFTIGTQRS
ncbi:MAG: hypothetical protein ACLRFJ_03415 [Alphaproteobacteria bacterium]